MFQPNYKTILLRISLVLLLNLVAVATGQLKAQQVIPLYPDGVPDPAGVNEKRGAYTGEGAPALEVYLPEKDKENRTAMLVFPGGSYAGLSYQEEGAEIGGYFAKQGIVTFVVKYRLPAGYLRSSKDSISGDRYLTPLQDAQQAIKQVRMEAKRWNVNPNRIGVIGFSAGGHVASSLGTHFGKSYIPNIEDTSVRPDFMILVYPVVSMKDEIAHAGSRNSLLGVRPTREKLQFFSNEEQVTEKTPPTYLTHTGDDEVVKVDNSIVFYQALLRHKVPAEMHLFASGNHGFVLDMPPLEWMNPILLWMRKGGWLNGL